MDPIDRLAGLDVFRDPFDPSALIVGLRAELYRGIRADLIAKVGDFDLKAALQALTAFSPKPDFAFVHPAQYRRTRRFWAELAIRDALGGRRKGTRIRSSVPFRRRRAFAMEAVLDLWRRERLGPERGALWDPMAGV